MYNRFIKVWCFVYRFRFVVALTPYIIKLYRSLSSGRAFFLVYTFVDGGICGLDYIRSIKMQPHFIDAYTLGYLVLAFGNIILAFIK